MAKKKLSEDFGYITKPIKTPVKVTENNTEKVTELITENNTEKVTELFTELKNNITSKRPTGKTKQTISIDKKKYEKIKKYCKKNNVSFQSLMTQLIDVFYKDL